MISEFKIHKSSMLYDNKTGVIFEKPYNEFAQAHLNSHNNKYLQALQDILSKSAIDGSVVELSPDAIEQYFKLNGFTELILKRLMSATCAVNIAYIRIIIRTQVNIVITVCLWT